MGVFYPKIAQFFMKYDPQLVEKKWQRFWHANKTFKTQESSQKPKYYILDMFPYPSGAGLHVGHLVGYTATDVLGRYKKSLGFEVLHPMGWDSFGLPAEQYAIRTGTHPEATTQANITKFKAQMQAMGYGYDWDREIQTSKPDYYKWTQYLFTKLYEKGLAYEAELLVNYCPALGTVLANEEVEDGKAKEGGHPVERRPLRQWVLKITAYAERLLHDLEDLDWPEGLKKLQKNWIGKSKGLQIDFPVQGHHEAITIFTTRPDTLFGATYLVLAPEHALVESVTTAEQKEQVVAYQKACSLKSDLERTELAKDKTGVFTGGYALNVATGKPMPIWIADYVLGHYGTGAVMAVPAHDERDFIFAKEFDLEITPVIAPKDEKIQKDVMEKSRCWTKEGTCIQSSSERLDLNGLTCAQAIEVSSDWIEKDGLGRRTVNFKLRDWLFSRQRYWGEPFPILHLADGSMRALELEELPLIPPQVTDYKPSQTGESPLAKQKEWVEIFDEKTRQPAKRETNTMPQWAGSCWYYLRFMDPHNQNAPWDAQKEQYWMPVDLYVGGAEHAVLHLLYARFWHKVFYDCDLVSTKEPFKKLCNQGLVVSRSYKVPGGHYLPAEEVVERDGGYYHWETGEALESQIEKMSKSKLNGVSPDEISEEFGADALRLYSLFMGPIEKEKVWITEAVSGCRRFLNRFFDLATSEKVEEKSSDEGMRLVHRLIDGVTQDLEKLLFNTAIAKMMEFMNDFTKLSFYPKEAVVIAVQLLAPFAPHLAEELWAHLQMHSSVSDHPWPVADPAMLEDLTVTYIVQINGKLRGRFDLPKDEDKETILQLAKENPMIAKHITGEIKKMIFVPNKLINLVI